MKNEYRATFRIPATEVLWYDGYGFYLQKIKPTIHDNIITSQIILSIGKCLQFFSRRAKP